MDVGARMIEYLRFRLCWALRSRSWRAYNYLIGAPVGTINRLTFSRRERYVQWLIREGFCGFQKYDDVPWVKRPDG